MKKFLVFLFISILTLNFAVAQNEGDVAPDFTLKDLSNNNYILSQNKGKVILVFLVGYNCTLCLQSAPTVKSQITENFKNNDKFEALVIDVWDGGYAGANTFKNTSGITAKYLQNGSSVASSWNSTKDRLFVIDSEGKIAFKGTRAASSDTGIAKNAVQNALNNLTTSVADFSLSEGFSLQQNFPNPAIGNTIIRFSLGKSEEVNIAIHTISGKLVSVPVNQLYSKGEHELILPKYHLPAGIYLYRMQAGDFVATRKMVIQ